MEKVTVKINGKEFKARKGDTVLNVLRENGFYVPTLCYHKNLTPRGFCRMCVAEINGKLISSCTTPVADDMEVYLDTPRVLEARRTILQLIFTERNHYCMYCEMSGDCELQALGYELGLDQFDFSAYSRKFSLDNSHPYILMDPNRCVLCRRCVRACSELAGHFVLTEMDRGYETTITADNNLPLGESSCLSCGVCVQVCPTGAIIDKWSSYLGRENECEVISSVCSECSVGCRVKIYRKKGTNIIVKIYGDMDSDSNEGVLCRLGRYKPIFDSEKRIDVPMIRTEFGFEEIDRSEVFKVLRERIKEAVVYVDGSLFNEEVEAIKRTFKDRVYSLYPNTPPIPSNVSLEELKKGKEFIVIGVDLNQTFGVIGSFVKRRVILKEARLILFDDRFNSLSKITPYVFNIKDIGKTLRELKCFEPIVIYKDLSDEVKKILLEFSNMRFLWLPEETNSIGLARLGLSHKLKEGRTIVFFGERTEGLKPFIGKSDLIIFAPYTTEEVKDSFLVSPIPVRLERGGSFYNFEGNVVEVKRAIEPKLKIKGIVEFLEDFNKISLVR